MTVAATRPTRPKSGASLLIPFTVLFAGFTAGALLAQYLAGALWGLVAAVATIGALRLAELKLSTLEMTGLVVGVTASSLLTADLLSQLPDLLTPLIALKLGGAWLVTGFAASFVIWRRSSPTAGLNVALIWGIAGTLLAPIVVSFGYLTPGTDTVGTSALVTVAAIVALIGGGSTLSGATGIRSLGIGAIVLTITLFAGAQVGFTIIGLIENIANMVNIPNFWPPDFTWAVGQGDWWWLPSWDFGAPTRASPLIETFRIAIISSLLGCLAALPVAFMASTITAPNRLSYLLDKSFMNVIRTVPDLFWAMLFVAGVGVGPFAGVLALFFFSLAIMSKLLSETIDSVDTGPLEAARATGGSHFPAVRVSVFPQVLPNYVAYALYIFEINIRASVVLGLVGAGGIGRVLEAQRAFFRFDRVLALVIVIFTLVFVIEQISVNFRRRLV